MILFWVELLLKKNDLIVCGIFSIITNEVLNQSLVKKLGGILSHRGPSGGDERVIRTNSESYLYLVHKRLSVLDLSDKGLQPMEDPESGCIIIYNGEVYNHKELRELLRGSGFEFDTQSDTEVVLKSYLKWGNNCINHFNS